MPPFQQLEHRPIPNETTEESSSPIKMTPSVTPPEEKPFKTQIVWRNVINISLLHLFSFYGAYLAVTQAQMSTLFWVYSIATASGFGVLVGSHRLWSHKSFKAHWSLRTLLMIMQTLALQNDIYEWSRDHRVHHKHAETDADPHNSNRGFFFAHMGWLMCKKHPDVIKKGKAIDLSDLWADPIVRFQRRFYIPLLLSFWLFLPVFIPVYFWKESIMVAFCLNLLRYTISLHQAWLVNSAAHMFGPRPYDKSIQPRENTSVVYLSFGEGYHNYHHTFPYDYSASELGWTGNFNLATTFIDFFAMLGLAWDRKKPSPELIESRQKRTGEMNIPHRNGKSFIRDFITGMVVFTWPIWTVFLVKYLNGSIKI